MEINRSALARHYIMEAVKNSSASIKACWTIVFTAATVGALTPSTQVLKCKFGMPEPSVTCQPTNLTITLLLFGVYFCTFIRFYLGGLRVFDIKYNEMFSLINAEIIQCEKEANHNVEKYIEELTHFGKILKYNDNPRYKIEVFWLLLQSLIVVSLAYDLYDPKFFAWTYVILLFSNAGYLTVSILMSRRAITTLEEEIFPEWNCYNEAFQNLPNYAATMWAINNIVHALIIFGLLLLEMKINKDIKINDVYNLHPQAVCFLIITFCYINIFSDFFLARNFYFPKFFQKFEISIRPHKI